MFLNLLQLCNKLTIMSQFEKEVSEAVDKFKKAFKQGIEMQELLIKVKEKVDGSQLIHIFFFRSRK
jgi:hypothetical protein